MAYYDFCPCPAEPCACPCHEAERDMLQLVADEYARLARAAEEREE